MKWPLLRPAIPDRQVPLYNRFYLHAPKASHADATIVWGTEIDAEALQAFLRARNRQSRVVITPAHALIRATALALVQFPQLNARVVGRRIYAFRDINVRIAFFHRRNKEIDLLLVQNADRKSLEQIAQDVWDRLLQAARGEGGRDRDLARLRKLSGFWFRQLMRLHGFLDRHMRLPTLSRLDATRAGGALVNDLSFAGAPQMRSYKPSRFPDESDTFNLTLGPIEQKVVARADQFVSVGIMPLFVRADHRLIDAYQLGQFLAVVRDLLNDPERLNEASEPSAPVDAATSSRNASDAAIS